MLAHQPTAATPMGRWLLAQAERPDIVGLLARAARQDVDFPIDGDFDRIAARLTAASADCEMHRALEEAEIDYLSH